MAAGISPKALPKLLVKYASWTAVMDAAQATLPSDCQACVDNSVAYYIRGECPS